MKYFSNSLPKVFLKEFSEEFLSKQYWTFFSSHNLYTFNFLEKSEENFTNQRNFKKYKDIYYKTSIYTQNSKDIFINKNYCRNKIINFLMEKGKKITAYNLYNDSFTIFFFFFQKYNKDLSQMYELYKVYYDFSKKNSEIFFDPVFIFRNLTDFLKPSYMLALKKNIKKKTSKKHIKKDLIIRYIKPENRINVALRAIMKFTKSFNFDKKSENVAYALIYLFLSNKNSSLYKKKILSYEKLIKAKKSK